MVVRSREYVDAETIIIRVLMLKGSDFDISAQSTIHLGSKII